MNYQECRAYIDDSAKYGSVLGLDNMREMLDRLGNPQNAVPYVHVAGTNGKGSVIAYYTPLLPGQAIKWADTYLQLFILTENVLRLPVRRSHRKILQSM